MTRDFTFGMYEKLLQTGLDAGYEHVTVREYLSQDELPRRFIIHRHDVDRKPGNALTMARLEAEYGISSTYYFRTIEKTFKPSLMQEIENLGHEVGYHYEDMDQADGNLEAARELFEKELARVREHVTVDTVCMHGNPLTAYDNRDLWNQPPEFETYGLLGEAYLSMDFVEVMYFSDTGRTWKDGKLKIKDHTVGESAKDLQADSTRELIRLMESNAFGLGCLLSHPNRWASTFPEYLAERLKDTSINLGKRGINLVS